MEELIERSTMILVCLWWLESGGLLFKKAPSFCFVMADILNILNKRNRNTSVDPIYFGFGIKKITDSVGLVL